MYPRPKNWNRASRTSLAATFLLFALCGWAAPIISQNPQSANVIAGQTAQFSVTASGASDLSYKWRRDGFIIAGATASSFVLLASSQGDRGSYDVLISDGRDTIVSESAMLRVSPVQQPNDVALDLDKSAKLETPDGGALGPMVVLPDSRFYVLGSFVSVDNQKRNNLARFHADATLDPTFSPPAIDGRIQRMAALPDGRVIIAGDFTSVDGVQSGGVARLNLDGTRDPTFAVGSGFFSSASRTPPVFYAIAVAADGSVFLSGRDFVTYQGVSAVNLIKLTNTGALDRGFSSPSALLNPPSELLLMPNGKLYGALVSIQTGASSTAKALVRFLPSGELDPTFDAGPDVGPVYALYRLSDGKILMGGYFKTTDQMQRPSLVRLNENGTVDPTFNSGLIGGRSAPVYTIDQFSNGDLLVSGSFPTALRRLKPDGTMDRTFAPSPYSGLYSARVLPNDRIAAAVNVGSPFGTAKPVIDVLEGGGRRIAQSSSLRFNGSVYMMALQPGGKLLVAGDFTHWNGVPVPRVVRLNSDFSVDTTFRIGSGPDGAILQGAIQPDGKILLLGSFDRIDGTTAGGIGRLNADGSVDTNFRGTAPGGYPSPPVTLRDGRILVPIFSPITFGSPQSRGFRLYNVDGSIPTTDQFGTGVDVDDGGWITAATRLPNGQILVGGNFTRWSGLSLPYLVRLYADGSVDPTWSPDADAVRVSSFDDANQVLQSTGSAIVRTTSRAFATVDSPWLIRIGPNGTRDYSFVSKLSWSVALQGHLIQTDDRILVWGYGANSTSYVARLTSKGDIDPSLRVIAPSAEAGSSNLVWQTALISDAGDIVSGTDGMFAVYRRVTTPVVTSQPTSSTVAAGSSAMFSVTAAGPAPFSYQWLFNEQPIAGATNATYVIPVAHSVFAGKYSVIVANQHGSTASAPVTLAIDSTASRAARLTNVSVRARMTGDPLIMGFTVSGGSRELLVRCVGPTLAQFGIIGTTADPRLTLYQDSTVVQQNDNWGGAPEIASAAAAVGAFPLATTSLDAALMCEMQGPYSGHFVASTGTGIVLAELYDASRDRDSPGRIANLSARYRVGAGEDILIAGFSVSGAGPKGLLLRGIGPTLSRFEVGTPLTDPELAVYSGTKRIAENNDWEGAAELSASAAMVGAFPLTPNSLDAALILYLPGGSYTVQLSGVGGTTGDALIEIYELP